MPMYLGPLGGLTEINPLQDFPMSSERFGGVHTAVTGRRTIDVLGHRATYKLRWVQRTPGEMEFLEALHHRLVPGPLRLVFPAEFAKNRLSRSAASAGYGGRDLSGLDANDGLLRGPSGWQPDGGVQARGVDWSGFGTAFAARFDRDAPVPVVPGETLTCSAWVRSTQADRLALFVDYWDGTDYTTGSTGTDVTITPGTWTRLTTTVTPGAGTLGVSPAVFASASAGGVVTIGGAQAELGAVATQWTRGGGAPVVAVDQMDESALWSPYRNPEMTLLEL